MTICILALDLSEDIMVQTRLKDISEYDAFNTVREVLVDGTYSATRS
ncbi:MAG: hypothetical protein VYA59_09250 [Pseudomonadota bacterium]|nr:hypothetical protein [Pseudomonadota bacterium]